MIGRPGKLLFHAVERFGRDAQSIPFPNRHPSAITGARRAPQQVEGADFRHGPLTHARRADHRALIAFHPNMLVRIPVRHKFTNFFTHINSPFG